MCTNPCELHDTYLSPYEGKNAKYLFVGESVQSARTLLTPDKSLF
jgi:hypothetical protein